MENFLWDLFEFLGLATFLGALIIWLDFFSTM